MTGNIHRENARRLSARLRRWRRVHYFTGLVAGVWFALMALTGVLINHQEEWGLIEVEVDNDNLPDRYTDEFHPETTRLNVVLSDLHSGRFFGDGGRYIGDLVALLVFVSTASGFYTFLLQRRLRARTPVELDETAAMVSNTVPPASRTASPSSYRSAAAARRFND